MLNILISATRITRQDYCASANLFLTFKFGANYVWFDTRTYIHTSIQRIPVSTYLFTFVSRRSCDENMRVTKLISELVYGNSSTVKQCSSTYVRSSCMLRSPETFFPIRVYLLLGNALAINFTYDFHEDYNVSLFPKRFISTTIFNDELFRKKM